MKNKKIHLFMFIMSVFVAVSLASCGHTGDKREGTTEEEAALPALLPEATEGRKWFYIKETNTAFLIPNDWSEAREEEEGGRVRYIATAPNGTTELIYTLYNPYTLKTYTLKKEIEDPFRTALSMHDGRRENVLLKWKEQHGSNKWLGTIFLEGDGDEGSPPAKASKRSYHYDIGDDDRGEIYTITFRALDASWDTEWEEGQRILLKIFMGPPVGELLNEGEK